MGAVLALMIAGQAAIGLPAGAPARVGQPASSPAECASLKALQLPDIRITEAVAVPANQPAPVPPSPLAPAPTITVPYCKVNGTVGREIRFTLLLPDQWNRKFMMGGGGGFVEGIDNQSITSVNLGYATAGTDTGHQGRGVEAMWALDNIERQLNFGHVAIHRVAEASKAIIRARYTAAPSRSYFNGCSNGGRQALMEAQRYPDDFDGIVAGAPAYDFTGLAAQFIQDIQAAFPDKESLSKPLFPNDTLKSIETQIVAKCDAIDGVTDGLMEDPRSCTIDVPALTGLSDPQKKALATIYGEKKLPDGTVIYSAQPVGGEGDAALGWPLWINGVTPMLQLAYRVPSLRFGFGTQFMKFFVFNNPEWDYLKYDFANYRRDSRLAGSMLNATDTNLDAFKKRGGKLVLYHGWSDAALSALATTKYYDEVKARDASAAEFTRLFMLPGVAHCGGGAGPDRVDWYSVIDNWVDKGAAPERIVATKLAAGKVARSRPLCAYPAKAVYKGTGSIDDEASFTCSK
ncbi:MAG: tannase/feruloyl esterase family alpha/beta hydrolase [Cyanobacteria bacterium]|nr:tannase/feruloyl esterase family alpha/beta hydrolase [Cyanobacteriota bacterium]